MRLRFRDLFGVVTEYESEPLWDERPWQRCPVCNGACTVPEGFYRQNLQGEWMSTTTGREKCRSCAGRGIVR